MREKIRWGAVLGSRIVVLWPGIAEWQAMRNGLRATHILKLYLRWTSRVHAEGLTADKVTNKGTKHGTGAEKAAVCCAMLTAFDPIRSSYALDDRPVLSRQECNQKVVGHCVSKCTSMLADNYGIGSHFHSWSKGHA